MLSGMGVLAFIASLVGNVAWPIVVLVLALVFRHQLVGLVNNLAERMKHLKRLQTPAGSAEFDDQLIEVKEEIAPLVNGAEQKAIESQLEVTTKELDAMPQGTALHESPDMPLVHSESSEGQNITDWVSADRIVMDNSDLSELGQESPEAMVLGAWNRLETTIDLIALNLKIGVKKRRYSSSLASIVIGRLNELEVLNDAEDSITVIARLRGMRNSVAHASEKITKLQAYEYAVSALQMTNLLINAYNNYAAGPRFRQVSQATDGSNSSSILR
jgi:hypothetical protein